MSTTKSPTLAEILIRAFVLILTPFIGLSGIAILYNAHVPGLLILVVFLALAYAIFWQVEKGLPRAAAFFKKTV